ncbi:peptide/nickel transport system ATP-binding protein/oligopeptide transport system ATP-binding protein [Methylobacillus rhizosphaerae]|uniref:Peptide/nickel transport system ATP-binding protein/oligopeptide transport system ATP-binding protein n=1 Tax=Methylobacillus rhizosphaerae TaxID=551994 RepID=A0A238YKQ5_9PROT|nr:ATP-binding cassette domain-containing protein [Methylobacillus rhizosphaerae]SNR71755.1 peptide/nickel transport system ATP-binding protein/oligopeptide transport system ATP-binding protein [Methylobacillus rhizosphaerae]
MEKAAEQHILVARNLNKTYSQRSGRFGFGSTKIKALDDVSLALRAGSTLAVVGESGSGKSTLARCLLQLQPLDSGEVIFQDKNLARLSVHHLRMKRRYLQMIFQDPFASLNPRMKVCDIVAEGLVIHGLGTGREQQDKVVQMLERVGLSAADMNKYPHQFSGGQRQRIGIARALVLEPKVVVCDEPVSALDVSVQAQILLLLRSLQQEMDLSYIFISHDLRVVRHIADDIAVMYKGRIVEQGKVEEIYSAPTQDYTRNLLNSIPGRKSLAA